MHMSNTEIHQPTPAEIRDAVAGFAGAAEKLLTLWTQHGSPEWVDDLLTRTYPDVIAMSFDEYTAELWAWQEKVANELADQTVA